MDGCVLESGASGREGGREGAKKGRKGKAREGVSE